VISSGESDWNADIINYDDLSVISSSNDEIAEVAEIHPAGTATDRTSENFSLVKDTFEIVFIRYKY